MNPSAPAVRSAAMLCALLCGLLGACSIDHMHDGSGGAGGSGGSYVSGGTGFGGTDTGGTDTGGTNAGGAAGAGGVPATMTDEEWKAALLPRTGEHEVWTREACAPPASGSTSERVGTEYQVVPYKNCAIDPEDPTSGRRDCIVEPYCETSADCTEQERGRCEGVPQQAATCHYPDVIPGTCTTSADCLAAEGGTCLEQGLPEVHCYPTGVCIPAGPRCDYPLLHGQPCTTDTDCTAAPGGQCVLPVLYTACRYGTCFADEDCAEGERCGCGTCAPADCTGDDACDDGQTCALSAPFCVLPWGFHCTTPLDECEPGTSRGCIFAEGVWREDTILCERL